MGKGSQEVTVGYKYYASMHLALCHGPVDSLNKLRIGDKIAWTGNLTAAGQFFVDKPFLFGGEDREGGVVGYVDFIVGSSSQAVNPYLLANLPQANPLPAFRNFAALVLKAVYLAANNPNIRPWGPELTRLPAPGWYDAKVHVGNFQGVNPAHILVDCLTNTVWGLGYSINDVDNASFIAAADTLSTELFGLSFLWFEQTSIQDFITEVVRHINGILYVDQRSGQFKLKLIRADYDPQAVPILDEDSIISVESFERMGQSELVNQLTVVWHDQIIAKKRSVTAHNMAARALQGGAAVATTREYAGCPDGQLAARIAERDLRTLSTALSKAVITTNRKSADFTLGSVFRLIWEDLNVQEVVYRIGKIEYGSLTNGSIRLTLVEDVFALGSGMYNTPPDTLWVDPISNPAPAPIHKLIEAPYAFVAWAAGELDSIISGLDPLAGFVVYAATSPTPDTFNYQLWTKTGAAAYAYKDDAPFMFAGTTSTAVITENTSTFTVTSPQAIDLLVNAGSLALLGDEWLELVSITATGTAGEYTVVAHRGILDTVPVAHTTNTQILFTGRLFGIDRTEWASGVTVDAKALTITGRGMLALSDAPADSLTIARRWARPYPPGNFKVNGSYWPTGVLTGDIVLTWAHRDHTVQLSPDFVEQTAGNIGPEAGSTYTVRIWTYSGTLIRTVTGITAATYTYPLATEAGDAPGDIYVITVSTVLGTEESWTSQSAIIKRVASAAGYGYAYGNFYGGV